MSILHLPDELLLCIVEEIRHAADINAFARTNRRMYDLFRSASYRADVDYGGSSALLWAAKHGMLRTAQFALDEYADCEASANEQLILTGQCLFINPGLRVPADFMFDCSGKPHHVDFTPLQLAICLRREAVAQLLLEKGATVDRLYPEAMDWCSMLHLACVMGLEGVVRMLLDKGANPEAVDNKGRLPMHYVVQPNKHRARTQAHVNIMVILLDNGGRPHVSTRSQRSPESLVLYYINKSMFHTEQERDDDHRAERLMKNILRTKRAQRTSFRFEGNCEQRPASEELEEQQVQQDKQQAQESRGKLTSQLERMSMKADLRQGDDEVSTAPSNASVAQGSEIAIRERQDTLRRGRSQLRAEAERRTQGLETQRSSLSDGLVNELQAVPRSQKRKHSPW